MKKVIGILTVILMVFVIIQTIQINTLKDRVITKTTNSENGETYEEMMARMHPEQTRQTTTTPQTVGGY